VIIRIMPSHKRSISSTSTTSKSPKAKRRLPSQHHNIGKHVTGDSSTVRYIYSVALDVTPRGGSLQHTTKGVFTDLQAANEYVYRLVRTDFLGSSELHHMTMGTGEGGGNFWIFPNWSGEFEVKVFVEISKSVGSTGPSLPHRMA
jgi:hypothetical protein